MCITHVIHYASMIGSRMMPKDAVIHTRVDDRLKRDAEKVLDTVDVSMAEAVRIFLRQVVLHKGLPFDVRVPNKETQEAIRESRAGKVRTHQSSSKDVLQEIIESDD